MVPDPLPTSTPASSIPAPHRPITAGMRETFIDALRATGNVTAAARKIGQSARTLYRVRAKSPSFAAAWAAAARPKDGPGDREQLEAVLLDRAINGTPQHHYFGGKIVGTQRVFSVALAIGMLRLLNEAARIEGGHAAAAYEPAMTRDELLARIAVARRSDDLAREQAARDVLIREHREGNPLPAG